MKERLRQELIEIAAKIRELERTETYNKSIDKSFLNAVFTISYISKIAEIQHNLKLRMN